MTEDHCHFTKEDGSILPNVFITFLHEEYLTTRESDFLTGDDLDKINKIKINPEGIIEKVSNQEIASSVEIDYSFIFNSHNYMDYLDAMKQIIEKSCYKYNVNIFVFSDI